MIGAGVLGIQKGGHLKDINILGPRRSCINSRKGVYKKEKEVYLNQTQKSPVVLSSSQLKLRQIGWNSYDRTSRPTDRQTDIIFEIDWSKWVNKGLVEWMNYDYEDDKQFKWVKWIISWMKRINEWWVGWKG